MRKKITILGSTGSIGTQALEVINVLNNKFEVLSLSAGSNVELIKEQIKKFRPKYVSVKNKEDCEKLKNLFPDITILYGEEGLMTLAGLKEADMVLVAVSGKIGLKPTLEALKNKKDVALANKETLVMAGEIIMKTAKENNVKILPVDSEHSAIFQCLNNKKALRRLIITSSGGPFRTSSIEDMKSADISSVLNHPRWNMGRKITVDSATLMNKGLEVIEAHHLFDVDFDDIKVVVHPQSYVHSAVEYIDGSIIAQIGVPSMHIPIQYALTYPERFEGIESESFDFIKASKLEFYEPDYEKFPSLALAFDAGRRGGTYCVCMNAANEEAVLAFLSGKICFSDIYNITKSVYDSYISVENPSIEQILIEDDKIRKQTKELIELKYSLKGEKIR